jgi:hypothetical protein
MRTLRTLPLLALSLSSCGLVSFDIEEPIPEQVVQGSPVGALLPLSLFQIPLRIDVAAQTAAKGTGPASGAHLKAITLSIRNPAGATFEFLDTLTIKVAAEGVAEQEVARLQDVPATPSISLDVVREVDLLPYIQKGATLTASATGRTPTQTIRFDGLVVVEIKI